MRLGKDLLDGKLVRSFVKTPVGKLGLIASPEGLRAVLWETDLEDPKCADLFNAIPREESKVLKLASTQLGEYFAGKRTSFSVPLDLIGSSFQKSAWRGLTKIAFGDAKSYSWQAKTIKNPRAVRAVGSANAKNPISIIIPCHRVIRKDDQLGGFAGGIKVKESLLAMEAKYKKSPLSDT